MKNNRKTFVLIECVLGILVLISVLFMMQQQKEGSKTKIVVMIENSDDSRWAAFKYGIKMAAEDCKVEAVIAGDDMGQTIAEQKKAIEREIRRGAAAVILEPPMEEGGEKLLQEIEKEVPVVLVGYGMESQEEQRAFPLVAPDYSAMGQALVHAWKADCGGDLSGKTLGIYLGGKQTTATRQLENSIREAAEADKAVVRWMVSDDTKDDLTAVEKLLNLQDKVSAVFALDDGSFVAAGQAAGAKDLHNARVYGIGYSTDAVHVLDQGMASALIVPNEFDIGYESLTEAAESLKLFSGKQTGKTVSYTVLRRDTLFLEKNQKILYAISH
mgnify:CR=1 FL=1